MVHRIHNRNTGYNEGAISTYATNNPTLNATDGATALDMNNIVTEKNKTIEKAEEDQSSVQLFDNISLESATYLQNTENIAQDNEIPNFEVDSIEIVTPQLFSNKENEQEENQSQIFEEQESTKKNKIKEPEMFENLDSEENFEIPAFLRRQKS